VSNRETKASEPSTPFLLLAVVVAQHARRIKSPIWAKVGNLLPGE
jgi:hypothetical protein